jgi:cytoskeletal protein RodZ
MHDLLKAYTRRRREQLGEPVEMHGATRQALQTEIARKFRESTAAESGAKVNVWIALWPRLVFGGAILAVLVGVLAVLNRPQPERRLMAQNTVEALRSPVAGPSVASPSASTVSASPADFTDSETVKDMRAAGKKEQSPNGVVVNEPLPAIRLADETEMRPNARNRGAPGAAGRSLDASARVSTTDEQPVARREVETRSGLERVAKPAAPQAPAVAATTTPAPRADSNVSGVLTDALSTSERAVALQVESKRQLGDLDAKAGQASSELALGKQTDRYFAKTKETKLGEVTYRFVENSQQKYRRNFQSPPRLAVLQSFEVRQQGDKLELVDADGSVYSGAVLAATNQDTRGVALGGAFQSDKRGISDGQTVEFRAEGTNQTLNQLVKVTATLRKSQATADGKLKVVSEKLEAQAGSGTVSVAGKAVVGGTNEFPFSAVSEAP